MELINTLADVRYHHTGFWFKNKRRGKEGFVGGLHQGKWFATWASLADYAMPNLPLHFTIWGVYPRFNERGLISDVDIKPLVHPVSRSECFSIMKNTDYMLTEYNKMK